MSIWLRSTLLVVAMLLTAGVARASCTYLGATEGEHEVGATSTTFN